MNYKWLAVVVKLGYYPDSYLLIAGSFIPSSIIL